MLSFSCGFSSGRFCSPGRWLLSDGVAPSGNIANPRAFGTQAGTEMSLSGFRIGGVGLRLGSLGESSVQTGWGYGLSWAPWWPLPTSAPGSSQCGPQTALLAQPFLPV